MALAQTSTPSLSSDEILCLEEQITELAAHIHASSYRRPMLIGEFDPAERVCIYAQGYLGLVHSGWTQSLPGFPV